MERIAPGAALLVLLELCCALVCIAGCEVLDADDAPAEDAADANSGIAQDMGPDEPLGDLPPPEPSECALAPGDDKCTLDAKQPSQATFCGDLQGTSVTRVSAASLRVELRWCPHGKTLDPDCRVGDFRNVPADGVVAEVRLFSQGALTQLRRLSAAELTPGAAAGCGAEVSCATLLVEASSFDTLRVQSLSGEPPENP
jgi:hypothetical protein